MGRLIDERNLIEANRLKYESRASSQYARFLDSTPTYVTYYHINNIESMTDVGYANVVNRLGSESPIKYNQVKNLPIYGMDELSPSLDLEQEGLTTNIQASGVILPNTVLPYPDDLFILNSTRGPMIFRVTDVQYDTIRSNSFYKIEYQLEYTEPEFFDYLDNQTTDRFTCIIENIGTEDKTIVRDDGIETMERLEKIAMNIVNFYMILFYDKRYNSLLYTNKEDGVRIYDSLLTRFVSENSVLKTANPYNTVMLTDEDPSVDNDFAYHESIYRSILNRDSSILKEYHFLASYVNNPLSVFHFWRDETVMTTQLGVGCDYYIRPEILELFKNAREIFSEWVDKYKEPSMVKDKCRSSEIGIPLDMGDFEVPHWVKTKGNELTEHDDDTIINKEVESTKPEENDNSIEVDLGGMSNMDKITAKLNALNDNHIAKEPTMEDIEVEEEIVEEDDVETEEVEVVEFPLHTPEKQQYDDELESIVRFRQQKENSVIASNGKEFKVRNVPFEYERESLKPIGESIVHHVIVMYLSGADIDIRYVDLDLLEDHIEYMKPNHETFILIPILLYVIRKLFDSI